MPLVICPQGRRGSSDPGCRRGAEGPGCSDWRNEGRDDATRLPQPLRLFPSGTQIMQHSASQCHTPIVYSQWLSESWLLFTALFFASFFYDLPRVSKLQENLPRSMVSRDIINAAVLSCSRSASVQISSG